MNHFRSILIPYIILIFSFVIFSYTLLNPDISYLSFLKTNIVDKSISAYVYAFFVFVFSGFYILVLRKREKMKLTFLKKIVLISSLLIFSYPAMLSYDIFNYFATAKVTFFYFENPYVVMPIEFIGDPLLDFMHAANKTALYGPVWILLTGIPFLGGFGNFIPVIYLLKILILVFYLLTSALLWRITKDVYAVLLFSLHPLVLIETLVSSHNDIVMMFFAVFAFYLLSKKRVFLAILFLTLSVLIKFATLFLLPVFLYALVKTVRGMHLDWTKVYKYSFFSMLTIFFLSPLREEIYPWYAVWFLIFLPLMKISSAFRAVIIVFSVSLLFRYLPFLLTGTHFGITPPLKWTITFLPVAIAILYFFIVRKWQKV